MPPAGFEHIISADERPQTYALDRAATGTGVKVYIFSENPKLTLTFALANTHLVEYNNL